MHQYEMDNVENLNYQTETDSTSYQEGQKKLPGGIFHA
jgi:hypothetical protein